MNSSSSSSSSSSSEDPNTGHHVRRQRARVNYNEGADDEDEEEDAPLLLVLARRASTSKPVLASDTFVSFKGPLPASVTKSVSVPSLDSIKTAAGAEDMIERLKAEALAHYASLFEKDAVVDKEFSEKAVDTLCRRIVETFKLPEGVGKIKRMRDGTDLVPELKIHEANIKRPLRMACESIVVNAFHKLVKHKDFVQTQTELLDIYDNFGKERSLYWRKSPSKARNTVADLEKKWQEVMDDLPALLSFHNAVLHMNSLTEKKSTLQHTADVVGYTLEGLKPENGSGRKLRAELRLSIVRKICEIVPKKAGPRGKSDSRAATSDDNKKIGINSREEAYSEHLMKIQETTLGAKHVKPSSSSSSLSLSSVGKKRKQQQQPPRPSTLQRSLTQTLYTNATLDERLTDSAFRAVNGDDAPIAFSAQQAVSILTNDFLLKPPAASSEPNSSFDLQAEAAVLPFSFPTLSRQGSWESSSSSKGRESGCGGNTGIVAFNSGNSPSQSSLSLMKPPLKRQTTDSALQALVSNINEFPFQSTPR